MFYSQIILAKKGPLGKVWQAAHWGDKKLTRQKVFNTDISASVDTIVNPTVPLALRVSGHLLLGVVRIYSHQVKFLMRDCEEAMVKIKLAFREEENTLEYNQSSEKRDLVQNFGDVSLMDHRFLMDLSNGNQAVVRLEALQAIDEDDVYEVPFELEGDDDNGENAEWAEAVDESMIQLNGNGDTPRRDTADFAVDNSALHAVNMTLDSEMMDGTQMMDETQGMDEEEQDNNNDWHAFNPEEDDEEEEADGVERHVFDESKDGNNNAAGRESEVSNIELVRADESGGVSMIGRPSALSESGLASPSFNQDGQSVINDQRSQVSDNEFPMEEEAGFQMDDPVDFEHNDTSLLSAGADLPNESLKVSGLDLDVTNETQEEKEKEEKPKKKRKAAGPRRRRKRRRIEIDNDSTELSSEHIKNMLKDTSDIVQQNRVHPAHWVQAEEDGADTIPFHLRSKRQRMKKNKRARIIAALPKRELLARPNIGDSGMCHPDLLKVWERTMARARGEPLPFKLRGEAGEEQRKERAVEAMETAAKEEAEEEDIEIARDRDSMDGDGGRLSLDLGNDGEKEMEEENGFEPNFPEDDFPAPFEEEEEEHVVHHDDTGMDFATDMPAMNSPTHSIGSHNSEFSLGAVNDLEVDEKDAPRQAQGDELVSSSTKWHKHTIKVLKMLKRNMNDSDNDDTAEENNKKELSYDKLSFGTSRRTACGVFFELLQLKTWDFIELDQESSYGDIKIMPGVRFNEEPPTE